MCFYVRNFNLPATFCRLYIAMITANSISESHTKRFHTSVHRFWQILHSFLLRE